MPREKIPKTRVKSARTESYRKPAKDAETTKSAPAPSAEEGDETPSISAPSAAKEKDAAKGKDASKKKPADNEKASDDLPDSYLDIVLEEKKDEVPCYENVHLISHLHQTLLI